jgi:hypothetical protein
MLAAVALGVGAVAFAERDGPAPHAARLPGPTVFVAPGGDDRARCTRDAPCASFARAYAVARPGAVAEVAEGHYPEQVLPRDPARDDDRAQVTFVPAREARVVLDALTFGKWTADVGASHVAIQDMRVGTVVARRAADLTFRNLTMQSFWIEGGRGIRFLGGSAGGVRGGNPWIGTWYDAAGHTQTPRGVVVDGVDFHDIRMKRPSDHISCLHIEDVDGFVVRNSRFHDCDIFDMLVMYGQNEILRDILIENNVFEPTHHSFGGPTYFGLSLRFGTNVTVRSNTSTAPWAGPDAGDGTIAGWVVANNIFPSLQSCPGGITFSHNLWIGDNAERCDSTDRLASDPGLRDPAHRDYRLTDGSPAVDAGDPARSSRADIDGAPRPAGAAPDAGAYELPASADGT